VEPPTSPTDTALTSPRNPVLVALFGQLSDEMTAVVDTAGLMVDEAVRLNAVVEPPHQSQYMPSGLSPTSELEKLWRTLTTKSGQMTVVRNRIVEELRRLQLLP
jgi:hypothetical protein